MVFAYTWMTLHYNTSETGTYAHNRRPYFKVIESLKFIRILKYIQTSRYVTVQTLIHIYSSFLFIDFTQFTLEIYIPQLSILEKAFKTIVKLMQIKTFVCLLFWIWCVITPLNCILFSLFQILRSILSAGMLLDLSKLCSWLIRCAIR